MTFFILCVFRHLICNDCHLRFFLTFLCLQYNNVQSNSLAYRPTNYFFKFPPLKPIFVGVELKEEVACLGI